MKRVLTLILCITLLFSLSACVSPIEKDDEAYTFFDDLGREVTVNESDKIAACHASFADCFLLVPQISQINTDY